MQTTLLGLAIAVIIALLAALIGPAFIDWNQYKPQFEAEASRVVGAPVRVEGALDARLLPAPILRLRSLSVGAASDPTHLRADKLDVEFSLSSLLRGEWRATQLSLDGVALDLGLDKDGRVIAPSKGAFNFGTLAIDRFNTTGRMVVHDAASGGTVAVDDVVFSGDVRALGSNMRGEGSFAAGGDRRQFQLITSQPNDRPGTRVKLTVNAKEQQPSADLDGVLSFDNRAPRFDGAVSLSSANAAWRISSQVKASPTGAVLEQVEAQAGPDANGVKLTGGGDIAFGAAPKLRAALAATQINLDGLASGDGQAAPVTVLRKVLAAWPKPMIASQIQVTADQIMLAGRPVRNVSLKVGSDGKSWSLDQFACVAPGNTQIKMSGAIGENTVSGPLSLSASDMQSFSDWLLGRPVKNYRYDAPLDANARFTMSDQAVTLSDMKVSFNGSTIAGNALLGDGRLQASLSSPSFQFDQTAKNLAASFMPAKGEVALVFGQATIAGQRFQPLDATISFDGDQPLSLAAKRAGFALFGMAQTVSDLKTKLAVNDQTYSFTEIDGQVNDTHTKGRLVLTAGQTPSAEGNLEFGAVDLGAVIGRGIGASSYNAVEPLGRGAFDWRGSIAFKAESVILPGGAAMSDASATVRANDHSIVLDDVRGKFADGQVSAALQAKRTDAATSVSADINLDKAAGAQLRYRGVGVPESRADLRFTLASQGRSAAALVNNLWGNGVLHLEDAKIAGLNPSTFEAVLQPADQQLKPDVLALVSASLSQAPLVVETADVPITMKDGRFHVDATTLTATDAKAVVSGGYDIVADQADIRAALTSLKPDAPPGIQIFAHGTPDQLDSSVDVSALASWLALRAIERETKRLDELEKSGAVSVGPSDPAQAPSIQPLPSSEIKAPKPRVAPRPAPSKPAAPSPAVPNVAGNGAAVAPLPPPIDIRPAPVPRLRKPRPPGTAPGPSPGF